jgi:hypothetical protein
MRFGLTILFLGLATGLNAQTLASIEKRLRLLEKRQDWIYDTLGLSSLPKLEYQCYEDQSSLNFCHLVDLNKDGRKDLIYSGPCKPYYQTGIFFNTGRDLKMFQNYPGKLVSIEKDRDKTIVNILKGSCCCDYYSEYIEITIWNDSRVEKNTITFEGNTEIKLDQLKELEIKGVLRTSPEINDKKREDDCSDQLIEGNHLVRLKNLTTVVQLSSSGEWKLVLYAPDRENSYVGWIK